MNWVYNTIKLPVFLFCQYLVFETYTLINGLYHSEDSYLGLGMSLQIHLAYTVPFHFIFFTTSASHAMFLNSCKKVAPFRKLTKVHSARKKKAPSACLILDILSTLST